MRRGPGDLDAAGAVAAVADGHTTPTELLADARARADAWEPWLGAVVAPLDRPGDRDRGPLVGTVAGIKDLIAIAGVPRGCGAPEIVDPAPQPRDATAVARLTAAGASLLATTATHALAFGIITPQTRNPRAPDRVAGGSSGGSAAAVAAGLVHLALGTDTGGSVRIPAACCGVVGLKTTRGRVPLTGVQELAWSLDTVGPLAASVADVALALEVVSGCDPADPVSEPPRTAAPAHEPLRVGVPRQVETTAVDADVRAVWRAVLDDLADDGAEVLTIDLPVLEDAPRAAGRILVAEAAAVHAGVLDDPATRIPDDLVDRFAMGRRLPATKLARAHRVGMCLRADLRAAFERVDVIVVPTLPCRVPAAGATAVTIGDHTEPVTTAMTRLTNPWNLAGVPAGSVPAGRDADGAPVGMQVIAAAWGEDTALEGMRRIERLRGGPWPVEDPARDDQGEQTGASSTDPPADPAGAP